MEREGNDMNFDISVLKSYLSPHQPNYGRSDIHSLLEMLWDSYTMYNPIDNPQIRSRIEALRPVLDALSWEQENDLFDMVSGLCYECERTAFLEGLRTGMRLIVELGE